MNSRLLCILLLASVATIYAHDHSATYYREPFSNTQPFKGTIESQWEGIKAPGLAIYGWNVTVHGGSLINISRADIVTSHGRHFNKTHGAIYNAHGGNPGTINGFHLEVADPCMLSLSNDETFQVHYHAETDAPKGTWGQYMRTETVPTLTLQDYGMASVMMPVCRLVYTPDLVCEMISYRFVHLTLPKFKPGETEEFYIIIESPLTLINQTLKSIIVSSGSECPTSVSGASHHPIDLRHVGALSYNFTVTAHAANVWIMLIPTSKVHTEILEHEPYVFGVISRRVTPGGDSVSPAAQHLSGGAIFGIIIAVIVGVGIIGFALYYFRAKWMPGQNTYANL